MKKLLITALFAIAVVAGAFAAPKKVSYAILANFNNQFKEASNVTWVITDNYTKAEFTADNTKMEVYYNADGDLIATSKNIPMDELPLNVKRNFAKKFARYNVKEAIKVDGFDEVSYYISGENEKEAVIIKVSDRGDVSLYKRTKK